MPDEDTLGVDESLEEEVLDETDDSTEEDPLTVFEQRIAALEQLQRQSVTEIRSAVGRVQSLSAKLEKTNDPGVEAKLRTELSGVSELLGLVTDSIDESILPQDVKRRVADARAATRTQVADAEINRRVAAAVESAMPVVTANASDPNRIEAAVISQIRSLGLDDTDPAFDWGQAAQLLNTQGEQAMWSYFGTVEKQLLSSTTEGPQRRPRSQAPRAAGTAASVDIADQLEAANEAGDLNKGIELLRSMGINAL